MQVLQLPVRVAADGSLDVDLPTGVKVRAATIYLEIEDANQPLPQTGAEIAALLRSRPPIAFVDPEITDPVEWVKAQRQKESARLSSYWTEE